MDDLLSGAIVMACAVIALYFVRFWMQSRDRLFALFSGAFWLLGLHYLILALTDRDSEARPYLYLIRLIAFCLIIVAFLDKNRARRRA